METGGLHLPALALAFWSPSSNAASRSPALVSMTVFFSAFSSSGAMSVPLWLTAMTSRPDWPEWSSSLASLSFSFEIVCQK